ncbi:hypothetical protein SP21_21 [Salmonella phage 21]|nr:hypothetical protein SP21_21 [Salmonella phage 21]
MQPEQPFFHDLDEAQFGIGKFFYMSSDGAQNCLAKLMGF